MIPEYSSRQPNPTIEFANPVWVTDDTKSTAQPNNQQWVGGGTKQWVTQQPHNSYPGHVIPKDVSATSRSYYYNNSSHSSVYVMESYLDSDFTPLYWVNQLRPRMISTPFVSRKMGGRRKYFAQCTEIQKYANIYIPNLNEVYTPTESIDQPVPPASIRHAKAKIFKPRKRVFHKAQVTIQKPLVGAKKKILAKLFSKFSKPKHNTPTEDMRATVIPAESHSMTDTVYESDDSSYYKLPPNLTKPPQSCNSARKSPSTTHRSREPSEVPVVPKKPSIPASILTAPAYETVSVNSETSLEELNTKHIKQIGSICGSNKGSLLKAKQSVRSTKASPQAEHELYSVIEKPTFSRHVPMTPKVNEEAEEYAPPPPVPSKEILQLRDD